MKRFAILALASCALAACGGDTTPTQQADDDAKARGEVLGGTITDDMLPLDTLTSQSPPMAEESGGAASGNDAASDTEADSGEDSAPAEQPEAAPEPAAPAEADEEG